MVGPSLLVRAAQIRLENDDRVEAKIDALLELVGKKDGLELIKQIDESHLRHHGHAKVHVDPTYVTGGE